MAETNTWPPDPGLDKYTYIHAGLQMLPGYCWLFLVITGYLGPQVYHDCLYLKGWHGVFGVNCYCKLAGDLSVSGGFIPGTFLWSFWHYSMVIASACCKCNHGPQSQTNCGVPSGSLENELQVQKVQEQAPCMQVTLSSLSEISRSPDGGTVVPLLCGHP